MNKTVSKKNAPKSAKATPKAPAQAFEPLFGKINFILMGASALLIVLGFILMRGNGDVVDVSSTKLTVAPVLVIVGFVLAIYSVMKKEKDTQNPAS